MILLSGRAPNIARCKHCRTVVKLEHRRAHSRECRKRRDQKKLDRMTMMRDGLRLYAIGAVRWTRNGWKKEVHHVHAEDMNHARAQFCYAEPDRKRVHILAVGLAIGWQANEKGDLLVSQPS